MTSNNYGVYARSTNGSGIYATATAAMTYGVYATATGSAAGAILGVGSGSIYAAVLTGNVLTGGNLTVLGNTVGSSTTDYAIKGYTTALNSAGVAAFASGSTSIGLYAQAYGSGSAAVFVGTVNINGSYYATGTKSAVVPHPDGSHRLLYCMESPEA